MAQSRGVGSRLTDAASRARHVVRRLGWTYVALWLAAVLGRRFSLHICVITTHRFEEDLRSAPNLTGLEARLLTAEEILQFARVGDYWYSRAFAVDALATSTVRHPFTTRFCFTLGRTILEDPRGI